MQKAEPARVGGSALWSWGMTESEGAGAVADDYVVDFGLVAIALGEALDSGGHEGIAQLVLYEVDGAAAEAAAHPHRPPLMLIVSKRPSSFLLSRHALHIFLR